MRRAKRAVDLSERQRLRAIMDNGEAKVAVTVAEEALLEAEKEMVGKRRFLGPGVKGSWMCAAPV